MPHIHEKIDFTVEVFLVCKNRVLIRKHDKYNIKTGVGGHIELNEDPIEAAVREVKEETGLDVNLDSSLQISFEKGDIIPPFGINRHRINSHHEHIGLFYCGKVKSTKVIQNNEKSDDIKWLTKEEIIKSNDIEKQVKAYALKALEILS